MIRKNVMTTGRSPHKQAPQRVQDRAGLSEGEEGHIHRKAEHPLENDDPLLAMIEKRQDVLLEPEREKHHTTEVHAVDHRVGEVSIPEPRERPLPHLRSHLENAFFIRQVGINPVRHLEQIEHREQDDEGDRPDENLERPVAQAHQVVVEEVPPRRRMKKGIAFISRGLLLVHRGFGEDIIELEPFLRLRRAGKTFLFERGDDVFLIEVAEGVGEGDKLEFLQLHL